MDGGGLAHWGAKRVEPFAFPPGRCCSVAHPDAGIEPLNDMPEMRDDTGLNERVPPGIEIQPPRITRSFGKHLEIMSRRMIAPDGSVHPLTILCGRSRLSNQ